MLTIGSCFSGIGGLELGLEWTGGFETKWQIEIDPYATRVLEKHWPNVKRYTDITKVKGEELERVDVICGGFPCQDVSVAGKRAGLEGKRTTLWSELFRLICEVKPRWFVGENVPGLLSANDGRFFGNILRDLASIGFDAEWGVLSAAGVGAPHLRNRVFILAYPKRLEWTERARGEGIQSKEQNTERQNTGNIREILAYPQGDGMEGCQTEFSERLERGERSEPQGGGIGFTPSSWWATEPDVGRVAYGIPSRVDRLKCLGNAVVPQVAQKIGQMILRSESK